MCETGPDGLTGVVVPGKGKTGGERMGLRSRSLRAL